MCLSPLMSELGKTGSKQRNKLWTVNSRQSLSFRGSVSDRGNPGICLVILVQVNSFAKQGMNTTRGSRKNTTRSVLILYKNKDSIIHLDSVLQRNDRRTLYRLLFTVYIPQPTQISTRKKRWAHHSTSGSSVKAQRKCYLSYSTINSYRKLWSLMVNFWYFWEYFWDKWSAWIASLHRHNEDVINFQEISVEMVSRCSIENRQSYFFPCIFQVLNRLMDILIAFNMKCYCIHFFEL